MNLYPNTFAQWIKDNMLQDTSQILEGWSILQNDVRGLHNAGCTRLAGRLRSFAMNRHEYCRQPRDTKFCTLKS